MKGLFQLFDKEMPVQMCNFHQVAAVRRYLTKNPRMQAGRELWKVTQLLTVTCKGIFEARLQVWHQRWKTFLNEQQTEEKGRKRYVHKRLGSTYRSLKTKLPWVVYLGYGQATKHTEYHNALYGHFAGLKNKLRNHNGLSEARKKKFIDEFFKA